MNGLVESQVSTSQVIKSFFPISSRFDMGGRLACVTKIEPKRRFGCRYHGRLDVATF